MTRFRHEIEFPPNPGRFSQLVREVGAAVRWDALVQPVDQAPHR